MSRGIVIYEWVAGSVLGTPPTSASFQVDLAAVQTGTITQLDMTNIQFSFPGIGPLSFTSGSSIGLDNAAFVDPVTGLPIYHDNNQGLAAIAYQGALFSDVFLLSLLALGGSAVVASRSRSRRRARTTVL